MFVRPNLDDAGRRVLHRLIETRGEVEAAKLLSMSRQTLYRALAGLPVQQGTDALLRERLASLR